MGLLNIVLFFALLATCFAGEAEYSACDEGSDDICKITSLDITPCKNKKCNIRRKTNASMIFDFTPNFDASNLESALYWVNIGGDLPFAGMDKDGCTYTTCPIAAGKSQTLSYHMRVGAKVPASTYVLKLKLLNKNNATQLCCFKTTIDIKK